jgi:hypothetical protein
MTLDDYRPSAASVDAVSRMAIAVGAEDLLAQHVKDNHEVLPHVLIADLRQRFVDLAHGSNEMALENFARALEEVAAHADPSARNAADVSFVEDLVLGDAKERAAIPVLRRFAGPATATSLDLIEGELKRRRGSR